MNQNRSNKGRREGNRKSFGRGNGQSFGGNRSSNFRRDSFSSEDREMHKAVCSKCGKACEVPFKPTEGKPVYCKDCYVPKRRF